MSDDAGARAAVRLLRDRTVVRAVRSNVRWIGRSVGWWTILYLLFWLGAFVTAGVESVARLERPPVWPLSATSAGITALLVASTGLALRAPPVRLDRRDLIRLGLGPVRPWRAMRWPFLRACLPRALGGLGLGLVWTLLATRWFHQDAPWAAVALPVLLLAHLFLSWLVYAEASQPLERRPGTALASAAVAGLAATSAATWAWGGAAADGMGTSLTSLGLLGPSPVGILATGAVLASSLLLARRSLRTGYPPRFASQSFVLGRLQAIRTWDALSRMAGTGGGNDPGERARLLAVLHDRPHALRPRRSLPLPPADGSAWVAVAWRGSQTAYRGGILRILGVASVLTVALWWASTGASPFLAQQGPAFAMAFAAAALLGGGTFPATVPLAPFDRTRGRIAPVLGLGLVLACCLLALTAGASTPLPPDRLLAGLVTLFAVSCLLEKISTWAGGGPSPETTLAAAVLAATPSLLASALGVPEAVVPVTALVGAIALFVPV